MKEFWNERYNTESYVYGTEPNSFFRKQLTEYHPGRLLLPMEGEGRNAVFAAEKGWQVDACDYSGQAREKAHNLAASRGVTISYRICDMTRPDLASGIYDAAALIYAHMPPQERKRFHAAVAYSLKPGGILIMEAFHKSQTGNDSGGPRDASLLYDTTMLRDDFHDLRIVKLEQKEVTLDEGPGHRGRAAVVRGVMQKR